MPMYQILKPISLLGLVLSLSACGGGDPSQVDATPKPANYNNATSQKADFQSVGFTGNPMGSKRLVKHNWSLDATKTNIATGDHSEPVGTDVSADTVTLITPNFAQSAGTSTLIAYIGAAASPDDVPEKIGATYVGTAQGTFELTSETVLHDFKGTSQLNLGGTSDAMTADLQLYDLTKVSGSNATALSFDEITMTGMIVTGTELSDGVFTTSNQGQAIELLGSTTSDESLGAFFGQDATMVAGHILSTGKKGMLHAQFSASVQP